MTLTIKLIGINNDCRKKLETVLLDVQDTGQYEFRIEVEDTLDRILKYDVFRIPAIALENQVIFEYIDESEAEIHSILHKAIAARA